jgi:ABC-type multidrug transport system fused ATPase/permease subunit
MSVATNPPLQTTGNKVDRRPFRTLLGTYLRPQWRSALLLCMLLFGGITLQLVNPWVLGSFIDNATSGGSPELLTQLALLYLGLALVAQIAQVAETYVAQNIGLTATNTLRNDLLLHTLHLDPAFHNSHTPGEMIERVDGDVALLGNFFSRFVVNLLGNAVLLVGVLVLLVAIDWRVGVAVGICTLGGIFLMNALRSFAVPHFKEARQSSAELFGYLEERLAGTEDIRSSGAIQYAMRGLYARGRALLEKQRRAGIMGSLAWNTTFAAMLFALAAAMGIGGYLFLQGQITMGTLYVIFNYTTLLRVPIEQISRQMQDLQQAAAGVSRISDLLNTRSALVDGPGAPVPEGALSLQFEGVSFGYNAHDIVLRDISFRLRPGEVLGLLGRTGSGKTTVTRLIFRLYDPTCGCIELGGTGLREALIKDVRRSVGMVTQDIQVFHASVRDNLTLFDPTIPGERVEAVLADLGLDEWLRGLPHGLDTKLAPGASGLSAGEAQLLAFARVFLHDPGLVILDEASSRLDPATERRLEHAVSRLLEGRTGIIIAHRLGTVQRADTIMILEDGACREYGPRSELERDSGSRFAQLLRAGMEEVLVRDMSYPNGMSGPADGSSSPNGRYPV